MSYGTCKGCRELSDRNEDGYCPDCASHRQASGLGGVNLHYGTCVKCKGRAFDLNSSNICGKCRSYHNL